METLINLLNSCSSMQKAVAKQNNDDAASEVQLNAFEFRNYRTTLEATQHRLVERIVNQWCAVLVKGKTLTVNGVREKILMDKDLLGLQYDNEYYPLKEMNRMEMFTDPEEAMEAVPYAIEMMFRLKVPLTETKRLLVGEYDLRINFEQEQQRLNFALTLRVLRTRDPTLDPSVVLKVLAKDDEDNDDGQALGKVAGTYHYNVDAGIPIVFSVSDLKIYKQIQSTSRLVYLEFFVRYPRQDRFLYAKSPTAPIPQKVLQTEEAALRRKKESKEDGDEEDDRRNRDGKDKTAAQTEQPKESMTFDLKNVKLKVPKVPHTIFGRLMAKDDYFPTAIGTFDFDIKKAFLEDRREGRRDEKTKKDPETLQIPMMSTWRVPGKGGKEDFIRIGLLTVRVLGYIVDQEREGDDGDGNDWNAQTATSQGFTQDIQDDDQDEEPDEQEFSEEEGEEPGSP